MGSLMLSFDSLEFGSRLIYAKGEPPDIDDGSEADVIFPSDILGHECMGVIDKVGSAVKDRKVGDVCIEIESLPSTSRN
jgi:threonine dehydrogenase-like Zn-dependent dehydrogenase